MKELFGIPIGTLASALAIMLGRAGRRVAAARDTKPGSAQLGLRNVVRRRGARL